jgi:hypothetical protein
MKGNALALEPLEKLFSKIAQHTQRKHNKQLLDEAEHDIKNYSDLGQCYLAKRN